VKLKIIIFIKSFNYKVKTYESFLLTAAGGSENLTLTEVDTPTISQPDFIRVRLHAAGINPVEYKMRKSWRFGTR
jgi:NADPH:quinone reductase-like Zn-dependent oxidoreductase